MNGMYLRRVWPRLQKTTIVWTANTLTKSPNGSVGRNAGTPVNLIGYVATPDPKKIFTNSKGEPVIVSNEIYFLGNPGINMDDNLQFAPFDDLYTQRNYLVRTSNYREIGDFSHIGVKYIDELVIANV